MAITFCPCCGRWTIFEKGRFALFVERKTEPIFGFVAFMVSATFIAAGTGRWTVQLEWGDTE